jgi:riboflavin synthase
MFTGLIEAIGAVIATRTSGGGLALEVDAGALAKGNAIGASVAVNGVCLTVTAISGPRLTFDVSPETLGRTTFATARPGQRVHLERALQLGGRLDGHLVQGHVDGLATVAGVARDGASWRCSYRLPEALLPQVVLKGSIALDGVSLTIASLDSDVVTVAVVPHTAANTLLAEAPPGARVHVETDIIGKYVARLLGVGHAGPAAGHGPGMRGGLDAAFLGEHGFLARGRR